MTTLVAAPEVAVTVGLGDNDVRRCDDAASLADRIAGAWEQLAHGRTADCPLCSDALRPRWSAGAGVVGGRCDGCASELS